MKAKEKILRTKEVQKVSLKITVKVEVKPHSQHVNQSKPREIQDKDEVPLISLRGYAISRADTATKMEKAQKALDEARRQIVLCK